MQSPQQQAKLDLLGVASFLHIMWTGLGPEPISPFLIFHALEPDPLELVNAAFIRYLDDDERIATLLDGLVKVESRRENGTHPVLKPIEEFLNQYCEIQVYQPESAIIDADVMYRSPTWNSTGHIWMSRIFAMSSSL
jgi:hypothetical protein